MKGGYQLVDFKGVNLTSGSPTTIEGIYKQIKYCNGKILVATNVVVDNVKYNNTTFTANQVTGTEQINSVMLIGSGTGTLAITSEDSVTITIASINTQSVQVEDNKESE